MELEASLTTGIKVPSFNRVDGIGFKEAMVGSSWIAQHCLRRKNWDLKYFGPRCGSAHTGFYVDTGNGSDRGVLCECVLSQLWREGRHGSVQVWRDVSTVCWQVQVYSSLFS